MTRIILNKWDGGMAEDLRTSETNQNETSSNFDITRGSRELIPFSDPVAETSSGTLTDYTITDVKGLLPTGTNGPFSIFGLGRTASGNQDASIFKKSSDSDITAAWGTPVVTVTGGWDVQANSLVEYKGYLWFLAGSGPFYKFTAPATLTNVASTSGSAFATTPLTVKPLYHPYDDVLYIASGSYVDKFDNTTYTVPTTLHNMGANNEVRSMCPFGNYLAIATSKILGGTTYAPAGSPSYVYLSNRQITTPQEPPVVFIPWGTERIACIENIGGAIIGISYTQDVAGFDTNTITRLVVRASTGGTPIVIKNIEGTFSGALRIFKDVNGDRLYFGFDGDTTLWVCGKNSSGRYYVNRDRYIAPAGTAVTTLDGINFIGDVMFNAYTQGGTAGYLARQGTSTAYTLTSSYTTTINVGIEPKDRSLRKKLNRIRVKYSVDTAGGTVGVLYRRDSESSYTSVISKTQASTGEYVTFADGCADGTLFDEAYEFQFKLTSVGNVKIIALEYDYEVVTD